MNEGYMCNTCKFGKVRPIQFSLKQAIINCDNPDCDSYLEKWPWECIITRPILNSSDLCRYEKDSTCSSSDSSGVHSDLGSSGVSQYSVTDREVETLLQKSYTSDFDFESVDKSHHTLQWQSGATIQEQEPFVALDDKMFSTDMPSNNIEDIFEDKYNPLVGNCHSEGENENINARNRQGLISLNDTGLGGSSDTSQEKDTHYRTNLDNDLESWLCKLEPSDLLGTNGDNCDTNWQLGNGDSSYVSPSKTLIPSLNSAFSEVSPSKLNLFPFQNFKTHESQERLKGNDENPKPKESSVANPFLSPVSSGFNEDYGDHATSKSLSSTEFSLPNDFSSLEIQSNSKSLAPEEKEDTTEPPIEVPTTSETQIKPTEPSSEVPATIETQIKPKPLSEEKKEIVVEQSQTNLNNNVVGKRRKSAKVLRNETKCKSIVTDPWSIPEMYIDELNIEVVLKNESITSSSSAEREEVIQLGQRSHSSSSVWGSEEIASHNDTVNLAQNAKKIENSINISCTNVSAPSDSTQSRCQEGTDPISFGQTNLNKPVKSKSENTVTAPQVVDLYKPVTLQPEVIDHYHEYFDSSTANFLGTSKLRLSVGYKMEDGIHSDYHSLSESDEVDNAKDLNTSSKYFSSLLSNIDFDENFCILTNKEKEESSLENLVSSKFFCSDSDSEGFGLENNNNINNNNDDDDHGVEESNLLSPVKEEVFAKEEEEEEEEVELEIKVNDPLGDISFKSEDTYLSESELPIVTVDENDDLKLYVPVKEEIKEEKDIEAWNHNLISIQDYSRRKRIRHKKLDSSRIKRRSAEDCQLPPNSCRNSLNVIDTQDHLYSGPSVYNLNIQSFTLGQLHDKFGQLKKEPEFFEMYRSDHDDSQDRLSSLEQSNSSADFLCEKNENENFEMCDVENTPKLSTCHKILKNKSYMRQLMDPCQCNGSSNSDFDTSFAKPFKSLPSKQNRRKKNSKNSSNKKLKSSSISSSLSQNSSVPDVLNLLKESGWIITPCNPVINYNVPEHPISPTVVPVPLQNQYGDMGSDMVLWSLTDREVSVPHSKKNREISVPNNNNNKNREISVPNNNKNREISVPNNNSFPQQKNAIKNLNLPNLFQNPITEEKNQHSGFDLFSRSRKENHSFNDLKDITSYEPFKRKKNESEANPLCLYNDLGFQDTSALKAFKTNDGSVYIRPNIKKEPEEEFSDSEESSDSESSEYLELPDDHLAYAEAIKNGYNVSAPPAQLRNVFIPPFPKIPEKVKLKPKPIRKTKENVSNANNTSKYAEVRGYEDPIREKAQNELKTIVSERPPNEVPDVVCMNIEGKLYVYHRKDAS